MRIRASREYVNLRLPNVLPGELNQGSESDDQKKNDGHHAVVLCDSLLPTIEKFRRESKLNFPGGRRTGLKAALPVMERGK